MTFQLLEGDAAVPSACVGDMQSSISGGRSPVWELAELAPWPLLHQLVTRFVRLNRQCREEGECVSHSTALMLVRHLKRVLTEGGRQDATNERINWLHDGGVRWDRDARSGWLQDDAPILALTLGCDERMLADDLRGTNCGLGVSAVESRVALLIFRIGWIVTADFAQIE